MTHCDFVNYWSGSRAGPALAISNYYATLNTATKQTAASYSESFRFLRKNYMPMEGVMDRIEKPSSTP